MRSPVGRRLAATAVLLVLAGGLLLLGRWLSAKGLARASESAGVVSLFVAVIALLIPLLARMPGWLRSQPIAISDHEIADEAKQLASTLLRQWRDEERLRRVNDPHPLPVRWEVTATAESAMPGVRPSLLSDGSEASPLNRSAGPFDNILSTFNSVPSHRLVVLGRAGAGKTVLVIRLARELLAVPGAGARVPVIVSAATWNPGSGLFDWIAAQLMASHPVLAQQRRTSTGEVATLARFLASGYVLPIIDGLDELPQEARKLVIKEINANADIPLVVTSRPEEYLHAVEAVGRAITRALVVELRPLDVEQAWTYLEEATAAIPAGRWQPVFDDLEGKPDAPLARVLTNPLMLWLARTIYEPSDTDPAELADRDRFSEQAAIELYLLGAFVPAVYSAGDGARHRWSARQARRWLGFLARYLGRNRKQDLLWWRLGTTVRGWSPVGTALRAALLLAVAWWLAVLVLWRNGDWRHGGYFTQGRPPDQLLAGPLGPAMRPLADLVPRLIRPQLHQELHGTLHVLGALHPWGWFAVAEILALLLGAWAGIWHVWANVETAVSPRVIRFRPQMPLVMIVSMVFAVVLMPLAGAALLTLIVYVGDLPKETAFNASETALSQTPSTAILLLLLGAYGLTMVGFYFSAPADLARSTDPLRIFRLDRRYSLFRRIMAYGSRAVLIWLCFGSAITLAFGMYGAIAVATKPFDGSSYYASEHFANTRFWLACTRRMPWHALTFLADAHRRGVLRQNGCVYQFRHVLLQQQLAVRPRWRTRYHRHVASWRQRRH